MSIENPTLVHFTPLEVKDFLTGFRHFTLGPPFRRAGLAPAAGAGFSSLLTNEYRVSRYESFMQNKPNFRNGKMNTTFYLTKDYKNDTAFRLRENKPNPPAPRNLWLIYVLLSPIYSGTSCLIS
jgi:hypothetical protein